MSDNPFANRAAELIGGEPVDFRRAGGDVVCETCGKEYRRHPFTAHRDWNDAPFLHKLCDGSLVKL